MHERNLKNVVEWNSSNLDISIFFINLSKICSIEIIIFPVIFSVANNFRTTMESLAWFLTEMQLIIKCVKFVAI